VGLIESAIRNAWGRDGESREGNNSQPGHEEQRLATPHHEDIFSLILRYPSDLAVVVESEAYQYVSLRRLAERPLEDGPHSLRSIYRLAHPLCPSLPLLPIAAQAERPPPKNRDSDASNGFPAGGACYGLESTAHAYRA